MFAFWASSGAVDAAFTDRHGGFSGDPYASLNLAESHDDPDAVARNLDVVTNAFGRRGRMAGGVRRGRVCGDPSEPLARVVSMHQVHGADVHVVHEGDLEAPVADALVTSLPGVALMVRVADCVPVLLADPDRRVVGAAHAGRLGMAAGVVPAAVEAMKDQGARRIVGWLGPHVCGRCYEVPERLRAEVSDMLPEAFAETSWGTPSLDLGGGVRAQLEALGVESVDVGLCTMEDEDLFSHRRQGAHSGRMAGLVWVRP